MVNRVQLLQDAAVGIINIDQNDVIKVLTIASVVGIPPVLVAGIYGMNFKNIHEYDWAWGYQWSLALIVISALLPLHLVQVEELDVNARRVGKGAERRAHAF